MYLPQHFREEDRTALLDFMRAHSFATLVSVVDGAPFATPLPLALQAEGQRLTLLGHTAKGNPQWRTLAEQKEVLVIFAGPHAYISPSLYAQRESVPTWNYITVHAYGAARLLTEPAEAEAMLAALVRRNEPIYQAQWDSLPERYRTGMLNGIAAFAIEVTRLEGKFKLSQNRAPAEQANILRALEALGDADSVELAGQMRRRGRA